MPPRLRKGRRARAKEPQRPQQPDDLLPASARRSRLAFTTPYAADKKFDLALAELDEVLKTSPDDYPALYQLGKLAAVSGQFLDRGLISLRHCLGLTPPDATGHAAAQWRIGNILEKKNDPAADALKNWNSGQPTAHLKNQPSCSWRAGGQNQIQPGHPLLNLKRPPCMPEPADPLFGAKESSF